MSTFYCQCGAVHRDEDSADASFVAYSLTVLSAAEARIAALTEQFRSTNQTNRAEWIGIYFGENYPVNEADQSVVEDIISRELNVDFTAMFRCATCGRVALFDPQCCKWTFYLLDEPAQP